MPVFTKTVSIISALLSGSVYDAKPESTPTSTHAPASVHQSVDVESEQRQIMIDARIAMGKELKKH